VRRRRSWLIATLTAVVLFSLMTLVPVMPWHATCYEEPVPGPYRPIFLKLVTLSLWRQSVYYWRVDDIILLRLLPIFDGYRTIRRDTILLNMQKISDMLEEETVVDGTVYPKPPAVWQVEEEQRRRGVYDGFDLCRAAIQVSPLDPPVP
jgi:hypothetical protein